MHCSWFVNKSAVLCHSASIPCLDHSIMCHLRGSDGLISFSDRTFATGSSPMTACGSSANLARLADGDTCLAFCCNATIASVDDDVYASL